MGQFWPVKILHNYIVDTQTNVSKILCMLPTDRAEIKKNLVANGKN